MNVMTSLRARVSNPVIDTEFAERLGTTMATTKFDIHQSIADLYAGAPPKFMGDLYSNLVWHLDNMVIANNLKQMATKMPEPVTPPTIDSQAELASALDEQWESENNTYEVGYEITGPLHTIVAALNVRAKWIDAAQIAATAMNRAYAVFSINTTVGTPRKQKVGSEFLANASNDALTDAGLITDAPARLQFSYGVNWLAAIKSIEANIRAEHPFDTKEQHAAMAETSPERQELVVKLMRCDDKVRQALETYEADIAQRTALLDKWYDRELARIPVQMAIYEFCQNKLQTGDEMSQEFYDLPAQIQVNACAFAINALANTTATFKDKAPYTYTSYKRITAAATLLLNRVIHERCE